MLAAFYTRTGPAREVLHVGELETPEAGPGEVRVRLAMSGVNPSDVKTRGGVRSRDLPFPRIVPHSDGAGVIDQVGNGVPPARIGERVWVWNAAWGRPIGTAAQFVVLPAQQAVPLPPDASFEAGACLGIPALTAYHAVHCDGSVAGKTVLVAGGAGAVGHYAVQLARIAGAGQRRRDRQQPGEGVAGARRRRRRGRQLPDRRRRAALPRPHRRNGCRSHHRTRPRRQPEDRPRRRCAATARSPCTAAACRRSRCRSSPPILKNVRLQFFIVYNLSDADRKAGLAGVTALLKQDRLKHNIDSRLPLDRVAEAHELVESGKALGNVVIDTA